MKKSAMNTVNAIESMIQEIAASHKTLKEQIAATKVTLDAMEAESAKMQAALEAASKELMDARDEEKLVDRRLVTITARRSGDKEAKVWILATSAARNLYGTDDEWAVRKCFNRELCGNTTWFDNLTVHDLAENPYPCGKLSRWIDEEAFEDAKRFASERAKKLGKRRWAMKDYDEEAVVKRYEEIHNASKVAEEFGIHFTTVGHVLRRYGVKTSGYGRYSKSGFRITPAMEVEVVRLYVHEGRTQRWIADYFGITGATVSNILRRNGIGRGLDR